MGLEFLVIYLVIDFSSLLIKQSTKKLFPTFFEPTKLTIATSELLESPEIKSKNYQVTYSFVDTLLWARTLTDLDDNALSSMEFLLA